MSNIDKQALREIAAAAVGAHERLSAMPPDDIFDISLAEGTQLDADITALNAMNASANPATVLALLDELEAKDKRIVELEAPAPELKMAHLINKFYERYPLAEFKSDTERSAALGYFMSGAELQCFGEFINYAELMGDE